MGLFKAGGVGKRNCRARRANLRGIFAALVVEIEKFISAVGVNWI